MIDRREFRREIPNDGPWAELDTPPLLKSLSCAAAVEREREREKELIDVYFFILFYFDGW